MPEFRQADRFYCQGKPCLAILARWAASARGTALQGIFIGTFLIGLREGLEATLIVGIVGAFLRRNGRTVRPMMIGVGVAVVLSIAVGVGLDVLSASLPQREQEMLETVIGAVAVVFVTTMIIWMNRNAGHLKGELESGAAEAINAGGSLALATMALLAVLKEGFETAVFLLAAAQATRGSGWMALLGGVAGIAVAVVIGVGIYFGGLKLNLGRFFRVTGVFLVFIAAGLVMSTLRTAHEAGWIDVGQQRVFDFSSWMPARSVLGALLTGMFGIQTDPRTIEVLGWLLYAVPVLVIFLWPASLAATPRARRVVLAATSAVLVLAALALPLVVPAQAGPAPDERRTVTRADGTTATIAFARDGDAARLTVDGTDPIRLTAAGSQRTDGLDTELWQTRAPADPGLDTPTTTLAQLAELTGGRLPVGLGPARTPGPFQVTWSASASYTVATRGAAVVSARADGNRIAVLRGGGLPGDKTVSLGAPSSDWSTSGADDAAVAAALTQLDSDRAERVLWRVWLPIVLAVAGAVAAVMAVRAWRATPPLPPSDERAHHHGQSPDLDEIGVA